MSMKGASSLNFIKLDTSAADDKLAADANIKPKNACLRATQIKSDKQF